MNGPIRVPIKAVMPEGFRHEFRLFIKGLNVAIIKTEPPNFLLAWEISFGGLTDMEFMEKTLWSLKVGDWILEQLKTTS
jgi:hypothetical protein